MAIIDESAFEPVPTQNCFSMLFHDIVYQFEMEIDSRTTFSHRKTKTAIKFTDKNQFLCTNCTQNAIFTAQIDPHSYATIFFNTKPRLHLIRYC